MRKSNKISIFIIMLIGIILLMPENTFCQQDREQKIGDPKKRKEFSFQLKGDVRTAKDDKPVPNADITVTEMTRNKIISQTKANASGAYEVDVPKGMDVEVKAQAPEFFYDAFKVRVSTEDTTQTVEHDFKLSSELSLRLNFPTNKYEDPYPFILDEDGNETNIRWQQAIENVARDLIKYQDYLEKIIITGHTDSDGAESFNRKLGENRAQFLMDELQKEGVPEKFMEVRSAGESELLEKRPDESTDDWKKRCRRVVMSKEMK